MKHYSQLDCFLYYLDNISISVRISIAFAITFLHFLLFFYDSHVGMGLSITPESYVQDFIVVRILRSPLLFLYCRFSFGLEGLLSLILYALILLLWFVFWIFPNKISFYFFIGFVFVYLLFLEIFTQIICGGAAC